MKSRWDFEWEPCGEVVRGPLASRSLADTVAETRRVLREPLESPPLAQSVIPGDRVTIAVEPVVPEAASLVVAVVEELREAGVSAADMVVLQAAGGPFGPPRELLAGLSPELSREITLATHSVEDRRQLCLLGHLHGPEMEPIYLHRSLVEADMVVTLGCARAGVRRREHLETCGVFPLFSDTSWQSLMRGGTTRGSGKSRPRVSETVHDADEQLGVWFAVRTVPGSGGGTLHTLAGLRGRVNAEAHALTQAAWRPALAERARLVIACVDTDEPATWYEWGRALAAAHELVEVDGAIVLCAHMTEPAPEALSELAVEERRRMALRRMSRRSPRDVLVAGWLAAALNLARVGVHGMLDEAAAEELGLSYVAELEDLTRLAERSGGCIVLRDAQHLAPVVTDTSAAD